jgi:hypothetical protein
MTLRTYLPLHSEHARRGARRSPYDCEA